MPSPTRFTAGISFQAKGRNLGEYPQPDPTKVYTHFEDFPRYAAGDWTVTAVGTSTAAGTAGEGGRLLLTTGAVLNDAETILSAPLDFNLSATTQQMWGYYKFQAADVTLPAMVIGVFDALPGTLVIANGIYFRKNAAAAGVWDFVLTKASTSTTLASIATSAVNTDIELGFYYDGKGNFDIFVNEVKVSSQTTVTNLPTATAMAHGAGIVNGAAAAKTLTVDFMLTAQSRSSN